MSRYRVSKAPEALHGVRQARRRFRCDGHLTDPDDRHHIEPGQKYVASALPPFSDIGNERWWHMRFCGDCAPIEYVKEISS